MTESVRIGLHTESKQGEELPLAEWWIQPWANLNIGLSVSYLPEGDRLVVYLGQSLIQIETYLECRVDGEQKWRIDTLGYTPAALLGGPVTLGCEEVQSARTPFKGGPDAG